MTKRRACILIGISIAFLATGVLAATRIKAESGSAQSTETSVATNNDESDGIWISEIKPANVKVAPVSADSLSEWVTANGITQPAKDVT